MTGALVAAMRAHHAELQEKLQEQEKVNTWARTGSAQALQDLVCFLSGELLPHARAEEAHLYPAVEPLIRAWGQATATMRINHEFIEDLVRRIGSEADPETLRELILGLKAVFRLHLEKEERVYLPLIADHLSAEAQERILRAMHAEGEAHRGLAGAHRPEGLGAAADAGAVNPRPTGGSPAASPPAPGEAPGPPPGGPG